MRFSPQLRERTVHPHRVRGDRAFAWNFSLGFALGTCVNAGIIVLVAAVFLATGFGVWRMRTDGRLRSANDVADLGIPNDATAFTAEDLGEPLGAQATLVQFSTAFCAPCRATRQVLTEISTMVDGVRFVEIDAEHHLDLVRRLDIRRTPTVFVLDRGGVVTQRATGQPRKPDVIAALGPLLS